MDRKMFTIDRKISSPCTSAVNPAEQDSTTIVFWFSPSVKFFSVILSAFNYASSIGGTELTPFLGGISH